MASFSYYGRNKNGEAINGYLDSASESEVASYLAKKNIIPITIKKNINQISVGQYFKKYLKIALLNKKVDDDDLVMFCRQMRTINKAGLPLIQGLESLSSSISHGVLKNCVLDIIARLESGVSLSAAMSAHPNIFNSLFIGMVKVGESAGNLDEVFLQMSIYIERDMETKKAIKSAFRYPSFVLFAMILALFVVNLMVIPAFADMFDRFGAELPLPTKILLVTSNFFIHYWWLLIILIFLIFIGSFFWVKTPTGKLFWHRAKLHIPIIGPLINTAAMSRYIRAFSLMLKAGVPIHRAIELCSDIIDNRFLSLKIKAIRAGIEKGDSLYRTHRDSLMFSPLILQMIDIGESTGHVDVLLVEVAEAYEREVDYSLKSLSAKIEPLLIIVMAVFVVVLALGIFLPMWEMFNIQK